MAIFSEHQLVAGIDESGRGPLAGPVLAAAAVVIGSVEIDNTWGEMKDSKKMSPKKREEIFEALKQHPAVEWGIGRVSEKVIDRINILQATKLAMKRAVKNLTKKLSEGRVDFLIIDGNFGINLAIPQKSVIKGDEKIFLVKLASIVAKVSRDRIMLRYHRKYPQYGFDKHKGYGTKLHMEMLEGHGPCKIHRKSFSPVQSIVKRNFL